MNRLLLASTAAVLCLSGCGGDNPAPVAAAPVVIAPAPAPAPTPAPTPAPPPTPTPPPSPSYSTLFDEARDQSYAADVVEQFYFTPSQYDTCPIGYPPSPLSDGLNIAYTAAGRRYVLAVGNTTQQFTQGDLTVADGNTRAMRNGTGAEFSRTNLVSATFQYLNLVDFASDGQGSDNFMRTGPGRYQRYAVFGNRTLATDVPTTSVDYSVVIGGRSSSCDRQLVVGPLTSKQTINFTTKVFQWTFNYPEPAGGVVLRFDGLIDAGNRIRGSVYQPASGGDRLLGDFQGHLFGPNAREIGLVWNNTTGPMANYKRSGYVLGIRTP